MSFDESLFLLSLLALIVGAVLVWRGRRGTLVGRHLHCGHCGHDLYGQPIDTPRCPECGELIRYGRPRGQRTPIVRLMYVGGGLLPFALLGLSIVIVTQVRKIRWIEHEPLWYVLQIVSRSVVDKSGENHLDELDRRISVGKLTPADLNRTMALLLAYQADPGRPWSPQVGGLIEQFHRIGKLSGDEWQDYLASGFFTSAEIVYSAIDQRPLRGVFAITGERYGKWNGDLTITLGKAKVDDHPVGFAIASQQFELHAGMHITIPFMLSDRCWLTPGRHELEIEYEATITDVNGAAASTFSRTKRTRIEFEVEDYAETRK